MKNILIPLLLSGWFFWIGSPDTLNAQSIQSLTILPESPTPADSICIIAETVFTSGSCEILNVNTLFELNTFDFFVTHNMGPLTYICTSIDTQKLAPLQPGNYTVNYSIGTTGMPGQDLQSTNFSVQVPNGVLVPEVQQIEVYPSPFTDLIYFSSPGEFENRMDLQVYNALGRLMAEVHQIRPDQEAIDLSSLPSGLYFLRLATPEGQMVRKVIKHK